jgi:hypothetical protein
LQQVNDIDIAMAYTQQDAIQVTQEIATNTSDLILFSKYANLHTIIEQIWIIDRRIMSVVDNASKVQ